MYVKRTTRGPYNGGVRKRGSSPARECPQCGTSFYRTPNKPGAYCTNVCRLAAGVGFQVRVSPVERFWPKVDKISADLWLWTAGVDGHGYGAFMLEPGKQIGAHVYAYQLASGESLPEDTSVLHTCDIPLCVLNEPPGTYIVNGIARPCFGHLVLGTRAENNDDRDSKGRQIQGERHHQARLTEASVLEIRDRFANGETITELMGRFGVGRTAINYVVNRKSWRHVQSLHIIVD